MTDQVLFSQHGGLGLIQLNRPKALNALSLAMVQAIRDQMRTWQFDNSVQEVVVTGEGGRGLCAGGDVKALYLQALANLETGSTHTLPRDFLYHEYQMNAVLHAFPKPYIALMNGVCMGGGMGVAVNASTRIVTDTTAIAMPETAIGFIPDVGASYFLSRLPRYVGRYLGMTGARISAADALHLGLATHYVPEDSWEALVSGAIEHGLGKVLPLYQEPADSLDQAAISAQEALIDRCFGKTNLMDVKEALEKEGEAGEPILALMAQRSPSSMALALELQIRGANLSFLECLQMEFNTSQWLLDPKRSVRSDFFEGIRSVLVDKDHNPTWNVSADLSAATLDQALTFCAETIEFEDLQ